MRRSLSALGLAFAAVATGCAWHHVGDYDFAPVPRAGAGAAPVKAQVRRIAWSGQSEDSELSPGAHVTVEIDVHDADASRSFSLGEPQLVARAALGGPTTSFTRAPAGDEIGLGPPGEDGPAGPRPIGAISPRETRTAWATFIVPDAPPRGVVRLVVVIPVAGQPPLEVAIADPVPGGPRWSDGDPVRAAYFVGGITSLSGRGDITILEPFGLSARQSRGRVVFELSGSWAYIYQQALAGGPPASGPSLVAHVSWQPWRLPIATYADAGLFVGYQSSPAQYGAPAELLALPRVGAGLLFSSGPRLGAAGVLPFDRPLSPQRRAGIRVGYARWFNVAESGGVGGFQLAFELGALP